MLIAHISPPCTAAEKAALLENSTQAVIKSLGSPLSGVRMMLQEYPADCSIRAGETGARQLLYTVYLIKGREPELKAALIAALSEAAHASVDLLPNDVRVVVHDMPKTDIGMGGGLTAVAAGR